MNKLLSFIILGGLLAACSSQPQGLDGGASTTIGSFGANPNPVPANVAVQFSWTVQGDQLACAVDVNNDGTADYTVRNCSSSSRVSHVYGQQGAYLARLKVTGADGTTREQTTPVTVGPANTPPQLISLKVGAGSQENSLRYSWLVSDTNTGDVLTCRLDADGNGVWEYQQICSNQGSTEVVLPMGQYNTIFEVADAYSSSQNSQKSRVPYNRAPVIDAFTATSTGNFVGNVRFTVSDPDGDPLNCSLIVQSKGSFRYANCDSLSRTYQFGQAGSYRITLEVTDTYSGRISKSLDLVFSKGAEPPIIRRIFAGGSVTCVLRLNDKTYCWGRNSHGELGIGSYTGDSNLPVEVVLPAGVTHFTQIMTGWNHVCALGSDTNAYCWGWNTNAGLGDGTYDNRNLPNLVTSLGGGVKFASIYTGGYHTCGMGTNNVSYCWGENWPGSVGDGSTDDRTTPTPVSLPAGATSFAKITPSESAATCGIDNNGVAYCWGWNNNGQLGDGTYNNRTLPTPVSVPAGVKFTDFYTGGYVNCAKGTDDQFYCWGINWNGTLGQGTSNAGSTVPVLITLPGGVKIRQIDPGDEHVCALGEDTNLYCWGKNGSGQVGNGTTAHAYTPQLIPTPVPFTQIAAYDSYTCALDASDNVYCWGSNSYGKLGDGTYDNRLVPTLALLPPL